MNTITSLSPAIDSTALKPANAQKIKNAPQELTVKDLNVDQALSIAQEVAQFFAQNPTIPMTSGRLLA